MVTKKVWLSGIWLLPLLSALIGGWVIYQSMIEKGVEISILFNNAEGIREGKTAIIYKGVRIGVVRGVEISSNLQQIKVIAEIQRDAKGALRNTTGFWLVKPEVSLTEITGLETIVSGNYIQIQPGKGNFQSEFIALNHAPILADYSNGLYIDVFADQLGSVTQGSKIYYREIPVGEVLDYELSDAQNGVNIQVRIEQRYAYLIKQSSRFWNASGLSMHASLSGFSLHTESLAALIAGGIAFYTPDTDSADAVTNGASFKLHKDFDSAKVGIPVTIRFDTAMGLKEGATEVQYNAFKIGVVKKLSFNKTGTDVIAEVMFDPRAVDFLKQGTKFWLDKPKLSFTDFSGLKSLLQGSPIKMQVGEGQDTRAFVALNQAPLFNAEDQGIQLILKADTLGSIEHASPVLYKKIQVGQVYDFKLDKKGEYVQIGIYIKQRYAHLVASNSRFWNASGVHVSLDTGGIEIQTGTVGTLLTGGIEFLTPDLNHKKVKKGSTFPLYHNYLSAIESGLEHLHQEKGSKVVYIKTAQLGSLEVGSKVYYKKVPVGKVVGYRLSDNNEDIIISASIIKKYQHLVSDTSRFWRNSGMQIKAGLSGIDVNVASMHSLLNGGISFANASDVTVEDKQQSNSIYHLYNDQDKALQKAEEIQIKFALAKGITQGTAIKYLGIQVGEVSRVGLADNNQAIIAYAKLVGSATDFARAGSKFWLVSAKLGLFKNAHLETLVKGNYIQIDPGKGQKQTQFMGKLTLPTIKQGLHIVLKSPRLGSVNKGNTVTYRQIPVGEVTGFQLANNSQYVLIDVMIAAKYAALVKSNTKFWHASGVQMDLSLFDGVEIRAESVENIVAGGIAFATPDDLAAGNAKNGQIFELYTTGKEDWLEWSPDISLF